VNPAILAFVVRLGRARLRRAPQKSNPESSRESRCALTQIESALLPDSLELTDFKQKEGACFHEKIIALGYFRAYTPGRNIALKSYRLSSTVLQMRYIWNF
jgi:hypothetical protein